MHWGVHRRVPGTFLVTKQFNHFRVKRVLNSHQISHSNSR